MLFGTKSTSCGNTRDVVCVCSLECSIIRCTLVANEMILSCLFQSQMEVYKKAIKVLGEGLL
jgi:hypothetical protein